MSVETLPIQVDPVFDPEHIGASLDAIKARLPLNAAWLRGNIVGEMVSKRRGQGYDVDGVRPYEPGDDPRYIDHNITARQPDQWPQLREHYADVTPSMWLVTDSLQSRNSFNPGYFSEQRLALSAATAFMRIAHIEGVPAASLASNDHKILEQRQPGQGKAHILKTAKLLAGGMNESRGHRGSEVINRPSLSALLRYAGQRCTEDIVVVVSDFRDTAEPAAAASGWKPALDKLAYQGNNLIAVELTNPWDYELPEKADRLATSRGVTWIGNGKLGRQHRADYAAAAQEQQTKIDESLAAAGVYHIKLATDQPRWVTSLRDQISR